MSRGLPALALALALTVCRGGAAGAQPLEAIVRERIGPALPAGLGVARVHVPPPLARLDVDPAHVAVEAPRALRAGRPSVKITVRGRPAQFVPISIAPIVDVAIARRPLAPGAVLDAADLTVELRAIEGAAMLPVNSAGVAAVLVGATVVRPIAAGAPIAAADVALPPPLPRGAPVTVELRRGSVRVRGAATLEVAARPGEPAAARLAQTRVLVRGTLVAPSTVVAGD